MTLRASGMRPRLSLYAASPAGSVLLIAAAIWPVWSYLARAFTAPGSDPTGACLLLGALAWAAWLHCRASAPEPRGASQAALLVLVAYAFAYGALPALARALLGLTAFGLAILGLPGVGWRDRSGLLALILLVAPSPDTLNFFLGGPLRAASTSCAAAWLSASGLDTRVEAAALWVNGRLFSVDAPCSGVNGLWSGVAVAAVLAAGRRLSPTRTALLLATAAALSVPANSWRTVALVEFSRLAQKLSPGSEATGHAAAGLVVFAATVALLAWLADIAARTSLRPSLTPGCLRAKAARGARRAVATPQPVPVCPSRRFVSALLPATAMLAGLAPLIPARTSPPRLRGGFPGWPARWLGQPLERLPDTAMDRRWAAVAPGPLARFALADGSELLLRWVDQPGREVHPPEDCYRGNGYRVASMPPVHAPVAVPGTGAAARQGEAVIWRRFRAEREGAAWEVRGVIVSRTGETYPDSGWWWWRVMGPGARDRGPWWVITTQNRYRQESSHDR